MPALKPDPTFYPSPTLAMEAPPEELAYVAMIDPAHTRPDAMGVVDVKPRFRHLRPAASARWTCRTPATSCTTSAGTRAAPTSAAHQPNPHVERRYLVVPGIHSSRIHILDTKPDPARPKIVKVIEGSTLAERTGYAGPHTVHCGTDAIYMNALGAPDGGGSRRHLPPRPRQLRACWVPGKPTGGNSSWRTTSGGTSGTTR